MLFLKLSILTILLCALTILSTAGNISITPVASRTVQVRDAIVNAIPNVNTSADVTTAQLATITSLDLRGKGITALQSGDFSGLTSLTNLNLYNNELSSLPDGIFEGLTALTALRLGKNKVTPLPFTVSLEKVGDGQFKSVVPTGAPFDIVVPITATNGSISSGTTSVTIIKGSTTSTSLTVTRTAGTTAVVSVDIGTLPTLPINHYGYMLSKSDTLPVEVISRLENPPTEETPDTTETDDSPAPNTAPIFVDGTITVRSIAENTAADVDIGTAVGATDVDEDALTYTLRGTDMSSFTIDSSSGQLKTKSALDYETKRIYTVTITASDGNLIATISVIISVIDVAEMALTTTFLTVSNRTPAVRDAIVTAVPGISTAENITVAHLASITSLDLRGKGITVLQSGDFSGLTSLTNLNLYGNMLSRLPIGVFEGLTVLTSLRLGGNLVDPMPLIVSLQRIGIGRFRALIHTGAPFDVVLLINNADTTTITIPKGSVQSPVFTSTSANVSIGALPSLPANHYGYILAKSTACNRTSQVSDGIVAALSDITDCRNVTDVDLASITSLNLSNASITSLEAGDFEGMLLLTTLDLSNNQLTELPDHIFEGLLSLTHLNLSGNAAAPLLIPYSLEKVGSNQFKVVVPTGTPFNIQMPISVTNGSVAGDVNAITLPVGTIQSMPFAVTRTPNTMGAVMVGFGTLPNLPASHSGYALAKSNTLEMSGAINVAPVFTEGTTTIRSIAENTAVGTNIGNTISATDANNDTLTYSLSGSDAAAFDIDKLTGQLKTKTALDYETKNSYSVTITVSDGTLTDTIDVTINITDVDENRAPVFTEGGTTTRTISENTDAGVNIGNPVSATDLDKDTLIYSLVGNAAAFDIVSTTGQLKTKAALDYETRTSYSVSVSVTDGKLTDTIAVTINITDVDETPLKADEVVVLLDEDEDDIVVTTDDDKEETPTPNNAPVFTDGNSTMRSIAENRVSGMDIGSAVSATDADGDTLAYTFGGTDASSFTIDSSSGQLRTGEALDFETKNAYSVTITVSDGNGGSDSISVTINVTDVDEALPNNDPVFTAGDRVSRSVDENTGSGVNIGDPVSATDADDDILSYSLGGTDFSSFTIDSSSGQLRTYASLDYETKSTYSVTISVSDGKGGSDSILVAINITNVDETVPNSAPVFALDSTTRSVAENTAANTNIGAAITATDDDNDSLTYGLNGTDAASFSIDVNTGQLKTKIDLNHETKDSYLVTVSVSDGKGGTDSISVTINVSDVNESPEFTDGATTTRAIAENAGAGANIGIAVSATDPDDGETLTYTLGVTDGAAFDIGNTTGQLKTKAALDYETKNSYSVIMIVSDGTLSDTIMVTINVTNLDETPSNNPPVFTDGNSTIRTVAENTVAGTNIGTPISATDVDNNTLTYLLSGDDASSFGIVSTTGQLQTRASLNHEIKDEYEVMVTVSDGSTTDTIMVTISVTDVNESPVFVNDSITRSVAENTAANTNIGSAITATDPDGNNLTYTLGGTDATSFNIDEDTGQLKTKAALDYETKRVYSVTITAKDEDNLSESINVTINITDVDENRAPVFTEGDSTARSVAENTGSGVNIGTPVSATDADGDTLEYTLSGTDAASFDIDSITGQLRTKAALDYETKDTYSVIITASDSKLSDTITVTINVTNVDENRPPVFLSESTTRSVAENTSSGMDIGSAVSANDPDGDDLTYTLSGTDATSFDIDEDTGQLKTKAALDYETKRSYAVTITAKDEDNLSDSINVTINVTNVDENRAPVFTEGSSTTRSVAENTGSGVNIGTPVSATDDDQDTLTYTLGGTDVDSFDIDTATAQLKTKNALDYEIKSSYSLTITAMDGNSGEDTIDVTINVTDANDPPIFTDGDSTTRSIAENTPRNKIIGDRVVATDVDGDKVTYSLSGTDMNSFGIRPNIGRLVTKASLDFETKSTYEVTVTASDSNGGIDTIDVAIHVIDVNDAPVFTDGDSTTRSVAENTTADTDIGTPVSATDDDQDTLTYILGGTDAASFDIVSTTGQLKTKNALDHETKSSYTITITVDDQNGGEDTINVTVNITDVTESLLEGRTGAVRSAILSKLSGVDADDVTAEHLASITEIVISTQSPKLGDFDGLAGLVRLYIGHNLIRSLPAGIFDDLVNLEYIGLGLNLFETLPGGLFDNNTKLKTILLDIGELRSLPGGLFDNNTELTKIDLHDNKLSSLPTGFFNNNTELVTLDLSRNQIHSLPTGFFDNNTKLENLHLNRNGLHSLPSGIFDKLTKPTSLNLDSNNLESLPAGVFDTLTLLNTLELRDNKLTTLPNNIFDKNTALTHLYLQRNELTSLPSGVFDKLTNLTRLDLNNNELSSFPTGIFDKLTNLTFLKMYDNDFTSLPSSIFDKLINLTRLDLRQNGLTSLPDNIFKGLTELSEVKLESNAVDPLSVTVSLVKVESGKFKTTVHTGAPFDINLPITVVNGSLSGGTTSISISTGSIESNTYTVTRTTGTTGAVTVNIGTLPTIPSDHSGYALVKPTTGLPLIVIDENVVNTKGANIDETPINPPLNGRTQQVQDAIVAAIDGIDSADDVTAEHLAAITSLYLDQNSITSLKSGDFDGLSALSTLTLSGTGLTALPSGIFDNNTALETLNLFNNDLTSLPSGIFDNNTALTSMHLNNNALTSLPSGIFDNNTALNTIRLHLNDLTSLPSGIFDNNTALNTINLSSNGTGLASLPSGIFDNNTALKTINLHDNGLTSLPSGVFDNNTTVTTIYLYDNALTSLPSGIFDNNTALKTIYLAENSLTSLSSDVFDNNTAVTRIELSGNSLTSLPSGVFDNNTAVTTIHLYNNALTSLPSGIFDNNTALKTLYLQINGLTSLPSGIFDNNTTLKTLYLQNNEISDVSELEHLTSLTDLQIGGNLISDYGPLRRLRAANPDIKFDIDIDNNPPVFTDGSSTTRSVSENTTAGQNIGSAVTATDTDTENTLTYTLGGTDASSFDIVSTSGQLQTKAALDYETKSSYTVTVSVSDGNGGIDRITVTINVTNVAEIRTPVNERTQQVQDSIVDAIEGVDNADDVTITHITSITSLDLSNELIRSISAGDFDDLTALTTLNLSSNSLSSLPSGIFDDLTALTTLDLSSNSLSSLPSDIFEKLTKLTTLDLYENSLSTLPSGLFKGLTALSSLFIEDNTVDPLLIMVSLEKVIDGQFKAVCPICAPFDIEVPLTATNGTISDNATSVTISTGTVESGVVAITRTAGTTAAVTVDIGTLPSLPALHDGYTLVRTSSDLPLTVIDAIPESPRQFTPDKTALLANYPNPFNPETWIPFQLAKSVDVTLTIYDVRGVVVRKMSLGYKLSGVYTNRRRAIHWDGRNMHGEKVAGGVYFYHFKAGNYSALRKMLILK